MMLTNQPGAPAAFPHLPSAAFGGSGLRCRRVDATAESGGPTGKSQKEMEVLMGKSWQNHGEIMGKSLEIHNKWRCIAVKWGKT